MNIISMYCCLFPDRIFIEIQHNHAGSLQTNSHKFAPTTIVFPIMNENRTILQGRPRKNAGHLTNLSQWKSSRLCSTQNLPSLIQHLVYRIIGYIVIISDWTHILFWRTIMPWHLVKYYQSVSYLWNHQIR